MTELALAAGDGEVLSMTLDGVLLGALRAPDTLTLTVYGKLPTKERRRLLNDLSPIRLPMYDELRGHLMGVAELPSDPGPAQLAGRRAA